MKNNLEQYYRDYKPQIFNIARKYFKEQVFYIDDVIQKFFEKIFFNKKLLKKFEKEVLSHKKITPYFYEIIKNICLDSISDLNKNISINSLKEDDEENEEEWDILEEITEEEINFDKVKLSIEDILKECKTENERKICRMYLKNPTITEEEIAVKLGTYKMDISRILKKLRKRLKIFVTK